MTALFYMGEVNASDFLAVFAITSAVFLWAYVRHICKHAPKRTTVVDELERAL